jgi:hypothetical protein
MAGPAVGGATRPATQPQVMAPPSTMTPAQPGNVFQQSSQWLTQAGQAAGAAGGYQPMQVSAPTYGAAMVQPGQIAGTNLAPYMNPYTGQVIDAAMGDMNRARGMAMNDIGAAATRAGAFGGSRHGVAEAETNRAFADQAGQMAANLRQQGYLNAQGAAQQDIATRMQAGLANQASANAAGQFNAGQGFQAQLANQNAGLAGAGLNLQGAGQLGSLANLGFGMGQQITGQQMQQGGLQQGMMQSIIDAARGRFEGFTGQPGQSLSYPLAAVSGAPHGRTETQRQTPGLFNYLSLFLGM